MGHFTVDWTANSAFRLILDCVLAIGCFHVSHSASFTILSSVNHGFHVSLSTREVTGAGNKPS